MIPKFGLLMSRSRQFKVYLCFIFQFNPTLFTNMIKKKFFSGGFAPELFMVLSNVCAKFEPFLYFKIFCKIILKF